MKLTDTQKLGRVYDVFTNNGRFADDVDARLTINDLVTTEDLAPFVPKVVKRIIIEAVEPNLLITPNLFTRLDLPEGQMVEIGAVGSIVAGKIPQGDVYPQTTIATDTVGSTVAITVSKYGCAINISKEAINDNQFDVITLWLRAAGAALARLKESLSVRLIDQMGITVYDNADPANSENGVLTGRNIAGAQNGTATINDIFDMWAYLALRGFVPDTLLMSPLAWKVFAVDPQLREIVMKGAVLATRRMPLGSGNKGWPEIFSPKGLGLKYSGTGKETDLSGLDPYLQTFTPVGSTWNIPPSYLPTPMKVLVSHLVPFVPGSGNTKPLTNIIMADSQRCGILVQRQNPETDEDDIFERDVRQVHVSERYGENVFDQGKGIAVCRNAVVDRNYIFDNVNQVQLAALDTQKNLGL